jgi:Family of unknown function (DUF6526)
MGTQNYANHSRFPYNRNRTFPLFLLVIFVGSVVNVLDPLLLAGKLWSLVLVTVCMALILMWYSLRFMVIKVQDRAIRAEEALRHFILTGKPLPTELTSGQVVALRFASDVEFPDLVKRALSEKLSRKAIKKAVQQWRADLSRA